MATSRKFLVNFMSMVFAGFVVADESTFVTASDLADDEAYILVGLAVKGDQRNRVEGLSLHDALSDMKIVIPNNSGTQLLKVKAGNYKPDRVLLSGDDNNRSKSLMRVYRDVQGVVIPPQTVTYIGDWVVSYGERILVGARRINVDRLSYGVYYNADSLARIPSEYPSLLSYTPSISAANGRLLEAKWGESVMDRTIAGAAY